MSERPSRPAPPEPLFGDLRARLADAPLAVAVWTGFAAAALSCLVTIGVALLLWIPDADATATSSSIVHAGVITFLIALHGGAHLNGVHIGFVPLGMTIAAIAACARLGRPAWAHPHASTVPAVRMIAAQVAAFTATCGLLVPSARLGTTWMGWTGTLLGAVAVSTVGFGVAAHRAGGIDLAARASTLIRAAARAATAAMASFLAGGAVLATATTVLHHGRFTGLSRVLAGGVSSVPVALLQTLSAPNAVIAGSAYLAGPGFDLGAAHYSMTGNRTASVPAFPILAGLPAGSSAAPMIVLVLAALTVLGGGGTAGWLAHRGTRLQKWRDGLAAAALGGIFTGAALGALSALAGGKLGSQALRSVGPAPLWVALAVGAEVGAIAVVVSLVARAWTALRAHRGATSAAISAVNAVSAAKVTPVSVVASSPAATPLASEPPAAGAPSADNDELPAAAAS